MYAIAIVILAVVAAVITKYIIPLLQSKTSTADLEETIRLAQIAVTAAEQLFTGSGRGKEKLNYVTEWLKTRGITIDEESLRVLIESAVYGLKDTTNSKNGQQDKE